MLNVELGMYLSYNNARRALWKHLPYTDSACYLVQ